jgi:hypothetical protein
LIKVSQRKRAEAPPSKCESPRLKRRGDCRAPELRRSSSSGVRVAQPEPSKLSAGCVGCILPHDTRENNSRRNDPRSSFFVPALSTNLSTVSRRLPRCQYPQISTDGPRFSAADAPGAGVLEIGSRQGRPFGRTSGVSRLHSPAQQVVLVESFSANDIAQRRTVPVGPHSCRGDHDVCVRPRVGAVYTIAAERAGGGVLADLGGLPQQSGDAPANSLHAM